MDLNTLVECFGLERINSFSKYPSILTYHDMGDKGVLKEEFSEDCNFKDSDKCYITEKIDGTNTRIILLNGDYFIGSRENFLYAKGDRFGDPTLGIVGNVKIVANKLAESRMLEEDVVYILYGETYGGAVTAGSKNYTDNRSYGFRIFDVAQLGLADSKQILEKTTEQISTWREHGGQHYLDVDSFQHWSMEIAEVDTVPYISTVKGVDIPLNRKAVFDWIQQFSTTLASINATGKAEGIVIRNLDRSLIRKIRFDDYIRTGKKVGF